MLSIKGILPQSYKENQLIDSLLEKYWSCPESDHKKLYEDFFEALDAKDYSIIVLPKLNDEGLKQIKVKAEYAGSSLGILLTMAVHEALYGSTLQYLIKSVEDTVFTFPGTKKRNSFLNFFKSLGIKILDEDGNEFEYDQKEVDNGYDTKDIVTGYQLHDFLIETLVFDDDKVLHTNTESINEYTIFTFNIEDEITYVTCEGDRILTISTTIPDYVNNVQKPKAYTSDLPSNLEEAPKVYMLSDKVLNTIKDVSSLVDSKSIYDLINYKDELVFTGAMGFIYDCFVIDKVIKSKLINYTVEVNGGEDTFNFDHSQISKYLFVDIDGDNSGLFTRFLEMYDKTHGTDLQSFIDDNPMECIYLFKDEKDLEFICEFIDKLKA